MQSLPVDQRPRERLLRLGAAALSDAELVAVLLGGGRVGASAVDVAHELLRDHGGLVALASARPEELASHPGMGPAKASRVLAGVALPGRLDARPDRTLITSSTRRRSSAMARRTRWTAVRWYERGSRVVPSASTSRRLKGRFSAS